MPTFQNGKTVSSNLTTKTPNRVRPIGVSKGWMLNRQWRFASQEKVIIPRNGRRTIVFSSLGRRPRPKWTRSLNHSVSRLNAVSWPRGKHCFAGLLANQRCSLVLFLPNGITKRLSER
jgi:hypothetical protein